LRNVTHSGPAITGALALHGSSTSQNLTEWNCVGKLVDCLMQSAKSVPRKSALDLRHFVFIVSSVDQP
jgi:hypothetical protein